MVAGETQFSIGSLIAVSLLQLLLALWLPGPSLAILKELDPCTYLGKPGVCHPYRVCQDLLQNQRITICSYTDQSAIVCCPMNNSTRSDSSGHRRTSGGATRFDSDDSSSIYFPDQPQERISVQKCKGYRKLSFNRVAITTLTIDPTVVSFEVPKCDNIVKLIVGGNVTKPGEFPHMAAIGWRTGQSVSFDCGGSLISERFVLTAAHCYVRLNDVLPSFVRLGDQNLFRSNDGGRPKDYDIESFIRHPDFRRSEGMYNDIALAKLTENVVFNDFIRPACLYEEKNLFSTDMVIATGFGLTEDHGDKSNELLKVALNVYGNDLCDRGYANNRQVRYGIMSSQMCVGNVAGGQDTCQGDSGGPIQITMQENHCVFYIVGITSFGQTCGSSVPAVYTRVSHYLDWIETNVWK